jgi:hypothetical protein
MLRCFVSVDYAFGIITENHFSVFPLAGLRIYLYLCIRDLGDGCWGIGDGGLASNHYPLNSNLHFKSVVIPL